jgi:hypothetical protein
MFRRATDLLRNLPVDVWLLVAIILLGAALRIWLGLLWRPAFLGYPDSAAYIASARAPFTDQMRPEGYPAFISAISQLRPRLFPVVAVQHLLGLATALLAYLLTWQLGAPRWAGLIPAAVIAFNGAQVMVEHAILSEALFISLVTASLTLVAFAGTREFSRPWVRPALIGLAGLLLGASVTVRAAGLFVLPVLVVYVIWGSPWRRAAAASIALIASTLAVVFAMAAWHDQRVGGFSLTGTQFYNYYGRVATFADCRKFTPPAGTRFLCPTQPVYQREGHEFWVFEPKSPLPSTYGDGFGATPPPDAAGKVKAFALAVVLGQPRDYANALLRDSWRLFNPSFSRSPNPKIGNEKSGVDPDFLRFYYRYMPTTATALVTAVNQLPEHYGVYRSMKTFDAYESVFRFTGLRMALLLTLALLAPLVLQAGRQRRGALLALATGLVLLLVPIVIAKYDFRFTIPAYGPLAVAAAMAVAAIYERLSAAGSARTGST